MDTPPISKPRLNRRDFLKLIASLSGAVVASGCGAFSAPDETIVVVGAGVAGLSAARTLQQWGYKVIVLEARSRLGGRVWTSQEWPHTPLDLGASWIHGVSGNPITQLAKENNITTAQTDYENHWIYGARGAELTHAQYALLEETAAAIENTLAEALEAADTDLSVQALVDWALANESANESLSADEEKLLYYLLNSIIEHEYAADIGDLSAFSLEEGSAFGGADVLFPAGYGQIVDLLAAGLDIRLNERVQQVAYDAAGVTLQTNQGRYESALAIVTLPLGVLKSGRVTFSPALPAAKQTAIQTLGMGLLNKCYLRFPTIAWPTEAELFGYISDNRGEWAEWLNIAHYTGEPILLGFNAATFARTLESWSDQDIVASAMRHLRTMFGATLPDPLAWQITRWAQDPFALGSYSYRTPGSGAQAVQALASPVGSRLFFAGEATSAEYQATVHGAYLSGIRAAEEIWDS